VIEAGDLKFAAAPLPVPRIELERLRRTLAGRPVWLAASTHPGEEAIVIDVHRRLAARLPGLLTILAPRHPQRGEEVMALAREMPATRRAAGEDPPETGGIWIADSVGEYGLLFSLAGLCFMGGSLVPLGGHNPLEPARLGCAVAIGPHTANFRDAVTVLEAAGALQQVADATALGDWVEDLLRDESRRRTMGEAGIAASHRYADLPQRVAAMLLDLVGAPA
jgi:3-deoxy-D-manno-octulosonic-acid transferase